MNYVLSILGGTFQEVRSTGRRGSETFPGMLLVKIRPLLIIHLPTKILRPTQGEESK